MSKCTCGFDMRYDGDHADFCERSSKSGIEYATKMSKNIRDKFTKNAEEFDTLVVELLAENTRLNEVLSSRIEVDKNLREENIKLQKRVCKHEGHLPIYENKGGVYCELCQEQIG